MTTLIMHREEHAYNAPGLTPLEFLLALMNDTSLPTSIRMDAAKFAAPYMPLHMPLKTIHVKIEGGLPRYDDTAEPCADINDCINRTTPCPSSQIIRSIQGVNFTSCADHKNKRLQ
jgi:hypothetical protein